MSKGRKEIGSSMYSELSPAECYIDNSVVILCVFVLISVAAKIRYPSRWHRFGIPLFENGTRYWN